LATKVDPLSVFIFLQFGDIDRSSGVVVTEPETNIAIDIATMPQRTMDSSLTTFVHAHFVHDRN